MKVLCGDELGQIKLVNIAKGVDTSNPDSEKPEIVRVPSTDRKQRVLFMSKLDEDLVIVLRADGILEKRNVNDVTEFIDSWKVPDDIWEDGNVVSFTFSHHWIFIAFAGGKLCFRNLVTEEIRSLSVKGPISAAAVHPRIPGVVAVGGNENDIAIYSCNEELDDNYSTSSLWDSATWKCIFKGKNVKNDRLDLRVRIWITGIAFTESITQEKDGMVTVKDKKNPLLQFATVTHYGHLRFYNTTKSRRPNVSMDISQSPLTLLRSIPNTQCLAASDKKGRVFLFDYAKSRIVGNFLGVKGSATCIDCSHGLVGIVGLDRNVRIYTNERKPLANAYIKILPTSILILDERDTAEIKQEEEQVKDEQEEEEFWEGIQQLHNEEEEKPRVKKQKVSSRSS
ncbi:ribosome biogenesis protein N [Schizosaccharomyces japonicus yFS275]|uniref:Ribosome biogenesis protein NSA1 n=1 Tax=Schizosaccharomyces japonicus (strain yFS275 / FY16936) TaxID=402676 RepID=B6JV67_SCHJY|nr:ribosome biogenesis protein N [Schizosaccharomyces japonicus yFS275]EEB05268.1 ribosome biogenesis protein N [Schizosaccharomyces japonicus yFS275]